MVVARFGEREWWWMGDLRREKVGRGEERMRERMREELDYPQWEYPKKLLGSLLFRGNYN